MLGPRKSRVLDQNVLKLCYLEVSHLFKMPQGSVKRKQLQAHKSGAYQDIWGLTVGTFCGGTPSLMCAPSEA